MLITTGVGIGNKRLRKLEPRSQASAVVKCSKTREASIREIDSRSRGGGRIVLGGIELGLISDILDDCKRNSSSCFVLKSVGSNRVFLNADLCGTGAPVDALSLNTDVSNRLLPSMDSRIVDSWSTRSHLTSTGYSLQLG